MKTKDIKSINNLCLRYQNYDNDGTRYTYDILYTTIHSDGLSVKAKRQTGADNFRQHINELSENYDGVATVTVKDYSGQSRNAKEMNTPVHIELIDVKELGQTPKIIIRKPENEGQATPSTGMDVLQGLSGLFAGTEFEGLGSLAPLAKFMDDKHTIDRLREKYDEQTRHIAELERKHTELSEKHEMLNCEHEQLQDDTADMESELEYYRNQESKQGKWANMLGLAGASMAKNFLRQNPKILSGFIPAEQLAGIFSDDEPQIEPQMGGLSEAEQTRLDEATAVFDWLQTLQPVQSGQVIGIISAIRQYPEYIPHIIQLLNGQNHQIIKSSHNGNS